LEPRGYVLRQAAALSWDSNSLTRRCRPRGRPLQNVAPRVRWFQKTTRRRAAVTARHDQGGRVRDPERGRSSKESECLPNWSPLNRPPLCCCPPTSPTRRRTNSTNRNPPRRHAARPPRCFRRPTAVRSAGGRGPATMRNRHRGSKRPRRPRRLRVADVSLRNPSGKPAAKRATMLPSAELRVTERSPILPGSGSPICHIYKPPGSSEQDRLRHPLG
jgi:hypothetical protein